MKKINDAEEKAYNLIYHGKYEEAIEVLKEAWSRLQDTSEEEHSETNNDETSSD